MGVKYGGHEGQNTTTFRKKEHQYSEEKKKHGNISEKWKQQFRKLNTTTSWKNATTFGKLISEMSDSGPLYLWGSNMRELATCRIHTENKKGGSISLE